MPEALQDLIDFIRKSFPNVDFAGNGMTAEERIASFAAEIESGSGRTMEKLRSDVLTHIVGNDRIREYVKKQFDDRGLSYDDARLDRITGEFLNDGRSFKEFNETLDSFVPGGAGNPDDDPLADDTVNPEGEGVLEGGQLMRIKISGQEDKWVQAYEYPAGSGQFITYTYSSYEEVVQIHGAAPQYVVQEDGGQWLLDNTTDGGTVADEVLGVTGTWDGLVLNAQQSALMEAGHLDPTLLGQYLDDPEIQAIITAGAVAGWSDEQVLAAVRDTEFYKEVLFPGIKNFYDGTANPEAAWAMFSQNVQSNLETLGVPRDADGTYKTAIGDLLNAGVTDTSLATFTPTYVKAARNDTYRQNLNQWLAASGMQTIDTFEDFYDVIAGNSTPEVKEIVELAGLSFTSEQQGLQFVNDTLFDIAGSTEMSDAEMRAAFNATDKSLLALGEAGLRTAGLTQQDILRTRSGIASPDGRSLAEMEVAIAKAAQEQGIQDDPTAKIFTDFNSEGAPVKKGLASTISEGA